MKCVVIVIKYISMYTIHNKMSSSCGRNMRVNVSIRRNQINIEKYRITIYVL
jgi:hypothetical protein